MTLFRGLSAARGLCQPLANHLRVAPSLVVEAEHTAGKSDERTSIDIDFQNFNFVIVFSFVGRREGQEDKDDGVLAELWRSPQGQEARRQGVRRPARSRRLRAGQPARHEDPSRVECEFVLTSRGFEPRLSV